MPPPPQPPLPSITGSVKNWISMANETYEKNSFFLITRRQRRAVSVSERNHKQFSDSIFFFRVLVHFVCSLCSAQNHYLLLLFYFLDAFFSISFNKWISEKEYKIKIKSESIERVERRILHKFMWIRRRNAWTKEPVIRIRLLMSTFSDFAIWWIHFYGFF